MVRTSCRLAHAAACRTEILEHFWNTLRGLFWWNRGVKRSLNNDLDLIPARALQAGVTGSIPVTSTNLRDATRYPHPVWPRDPSHSRGTEDRSIRKRLRSDAGCTGRTTAVWSVALGTCPW